MLSHIATDLQQVYLKEVFTPQLGKPGASTPVKPKSSSDLDGDGDVDSFEKKVRQIIYDVRHIMKDEKVSAEEAFKRRTLKTGFSAEMVNTAKEKLGIKGGSVTSVSEESTGRMVKVTINYKNGTIDRRNVPYGEVSQLRSKPTISSVEISSNKVSYPGAGEKYEKNYGRGGQNTVGDRDKDGTKEPDRYEYAGVRDTAIKKSMSRKRKLKGYGVSEGFSNWREDLKEVAGIDDTITSRNKNQVKEKPGLDNHKDKIVVINPEFAEKVEILGGTIIESVELNEEYLNEAVDIATEFFYNYGLNENGVDLVIEELGEEKFAEFVFDLSEEYFLSEELKKSESKVKTSKAPKGTKQYATTIARVKKQGGTQTQMKSSNLSGTINKRNIGKEITAAKASDATNKAEKEQAPSPNKGKKPVRDAIARGIFGIANAYQQGMKRHRDATKTAGNALKVAGKGAKEFASGVKSGVEATVDATKKIKKAVVKEDYYDLESKSIKPGKPGEEQKKTIETLASKARTKKKTRTPVGTVRRGSDTFKPSSPEEAEANKKSWGGYWSSAAKGYKEEYDLLEKSESEQQQKLFGLALSVKRGETPRSEASAEVLKIVDSMSEKKIRDFAKTPHSEVPKKVTEAIANSTRKTQKETDRIQVLQKMLEIERKKRLGEEMDPKTPEQITAQSQLVRSQKNLSNANAKAINKIKTQQTQQEPQTQNASYEPEGNVIDELTKYAEKYGEKYTTRRKSVKGGNPEIKARVEKEPWLKYGGSRQEPKVPGEKPPVAGEPGSGRKSPENIVKSRRGTEQRAREQHPGSRHD